MGAEKEAIAALKDQKQGTALGRVGRKRVWEPLLVCRDFRSLVKCIAFGFSCSALSSEPVMWVERQQSSPSLYSLSSQCFSLTQLIW